MGTQVLIIVHCLHTSLGYIHYAIYNGDDPIQAAACPRSMLDAVFQSVPLGHVHSTAQIKTLLHHPVLSSDRARNSLTLRTS